LTKRVKRVAGNPHSTVRGNLGEVRAELIEVRPSTTTPTIVRVFLMSLSGLALSRFPRTPSNAHQS
jgi:hypothetical protein